MLFVKPRAHVGLSIWRAQAGQYIEGAEIAKKQEMGEDTCPKS